MDTIKIKADRAGSAITAVDLKTKLGKTASGLTFTIEGDREWLTISDDGIITGKPTTIEFGGIRLIALVKDKLDREIGRFIIEVDDWCGTPPIKIPPLPEEEPLPFSPPGHAGPRVPLGPKTIKIQIDKVGSAFTAVDVKQILGKTALESTFAFENAPKGLTISEDGIITGMLTADVLADLKVFVLETDRTGRVSRFPLEIGGFTGKKPWPDADPGPRVDEPLPFDPPGHAGPTVPPDADRIKDVKLDDNLNLKPGTKPIIKR